MSRTITATFKHYGHANQALDELIGMGVDENEISVLMSEDIHNRFYSTADGKIKNTGVRVKSGDYAEEGAAAGAAIGGATGALLAGLFAAGILIAPGIGLIAVGPMVAALAGAGAGGTVGGFLGLIGGMGFEKHEAEFFAERIKSGDVIIAVHSHSDASLVKKILTKHHGEVR